MRYITIAFVFIFTAITILAQDDACPTLVQDAIEVTETNCRELGRNQACYGNVQIHAEPSSPDINLTFDQGGDIADVGDIASLQLSSLVTPDEWGVAVLSIQANLPDTLPGQNVTIVLFGDVTIENAGSSEAPPTTLDVTINSGINVRGGAGTNFAVVAGLDAGDVVVANGRNEAGDWVRIQLPDDAGIGWVYVPLITVNGDVTSLNVVSADDTVDSPSNYGPMQSFTFRSGIGQPACDEAPRDGILIQTPEGAGTIDLRINEVQISLGSTAYLQAIPDDSILVALLEGQSTVIAQDNAIAAVAGTQAVIPANSDGLANGIPILKSLDIDNLSGLPLQLLPRDIEIPDPIEFNPPTSGVYTYPEIGEFPIECASGTLVIDSGSITVTAVNDGAKLDMISANNFEYTATLIDSGVYTSDVLSRSDFQHTYTVISPTQISWLIDACGFNPPLITLTLVDS